MQVYSADGELMAQLRRKTPYPADLANQIPPVMVKAFIATEDSHFTNTTALTRWGFSVPQALRCSPGMPLGGKNTITQQLARNFFLSPEKDADT